MPLYEFETSIKDKKGINFKELLKAIGKKPNEIYCSLIELQKDPLNQ